MIQGNTAKNTKVDVNDVVEWYELKLKQRLDALDKADAACWYPNKVYCDIWNDVQRVRKRLFMARIKQKASLIISFIVSKFTKGDK